MKKLFTNLCGLFLTVLFCFNSFNIVNAQTTLTPPVITSKGSTMTISADEGSIVLYTTDGTDPYFNGKIYKGKTPLDYTKSYVRAIAVQDNIISAETRKSYSVSEILPASIYNCFGVMTQYMSVATTPDNGFVAVGSCRQDGFYPSIWGAKFPDMENMTQ